MQPSPGTISVPSPHRRPCTMRRKTVHMARGIDACITASAGACVEILGDSAHVSNLVVHLLEAGRGASGHTRESHALDRIRVHPRCSDSTAAKSFAQARKALDRLRKLSSLKFFASKTQAKMTGEAIEISPAKRKELKELFSLIDEDGSGEVRRVCS